MNRETFTNIADIVKFIVVFPIMLMIIAYDIVVMWVEDKLRKK